MIKLFAILVLGCIVGCKIHEDLPGFKILPLATSRKAPTHFELYIITVAKVIL